jgi:hypothetical protein
MSYSTASLGDVDGDPGTEGLPTPNGKNRMLRPCRGRLDPKRRRKTSLERPFCRQLINLIHFFLPPRLWRIR